MPDIHVIAENEKHLHQESIDCPCGPEPKVDPVSGLLAWVHKAYLAFANVFKI